MFQDSACRLVKERTFKLSLVAVKEKKNRAMTFLLGKAFPVCSTVSGCEVRDLPFCPIHTNLLPTLWLLEEIQTFLKGQIKKENLAHYQTVAGDLNLSS